MKIYEFWIMLMQILICLLLYIGGKAKGYEEAKKKFNKGA
jgi:hypothetical protein